MLRGVVMLLEFVDVVAKRVGMRDGWPKVDVVALGVFTVALCMRLLKKGLACLSFEFDARLS